MIRVIIICYLCLFGLINVSLADITVTAESPAGSRSTNIAGESGQFVLNVPLKKNTVNEIYVKAKDSEGGSGLAGPYSITQVSLDDIVVAKATSERLTTEEVEELVREGVIDLKDPENWHVSRFEVVLNINKRPVVIRRTVATKPGEKVGIIIEGDDHWPPLIDFGGGKGEIRPEKPKIEMIVLPPPTPEAPSIPALLIIDGEIKTLKEFFKVKLLIINISELFTLKEVEATIPCARWSD